MEAGRMRFLAVYQEPTRSADAYNAAKITGWQDRFPVYCSIETLKAWELVKYRSIQMDLTHRIRCRWRAEIGPSGRLRYQGRSFDIFSINNIDERNTELEILANEVVKPTS
jgi:SPP1 family predicted phage head-tail adaptor